VNKCVQILTNVRTIPSDAEPSCSLKQRPKNAMILCIICIQSCFIVCSK